ncbi:hypothetical protein [Methylicorpusculum sp.]|uniref:hypothetical protein n=1 Tax=Methylicorpusculum sp. TaxID=2713644 RepID=UPI002723F87E|nr:hypothetical protein [Methylicorpusculum sp.]MDO8845663.1 hypothetical protein [Methylicorpusculum sp.]
MQLRQAISAVLVTTKQETDSHDRWSWVEASLWTKPMLTALDNGVEGANGLMPDAYFASLGLFTMKEVHRIACQSR